MNNYFISIFNHNWEQVYIKAFVGHLNGWGQVRQGGLSNYPQIKDWWNNNLQNLVAPNIDKFVHPFYIGAGNPDSEIIFIGKEMAADKSNANLMLYEQINNYIQWERIVSDYKQNPNQFSTGNINNYIKNFENKYDYCPLNPLTSSIIKQALPKRGNHYWNVLQNILIKYYALKGINLEMQNFRRFPLYTESLFRYCFTTELNSTPAKHNGTLSIDRRSELLCNIDFLNFINRFKVIWFNCWVYLKKNFNQICDKYANYREMIKQIFNADSVYACDKYEIYKSDNKVVIVSNNLSGAGRGIIGKSDILNIIDRIKE